MNARAHVLIYPPLPSAAPATPQQPPADARQKRRAQAWVAVHFSHWPLHAALGKFSQAQRLRIDAQPVAVLDSDRQRRVLACNRAAWQRGIRPGHALNAAIALCADIQLLSRDPAHETRLLESMALWAQQYTPCVSIEPPNELLLEVRGSLRLFGGAAALTGGIARECRERHIDVRVVLSPTARSALWLARAHADACIVPPRELKAKLASLPVQCLQWPEDIELRLHRFGVTTLGELLRLPRADLARRIGAKCMRELDCGLRRHAEIRTQFKPPERYTDRVILDFEIETVVLLETLLLLRLEKLQSYLRERNLALGSLDIALLHRARATTLLRIGLAAPTADMRHLAKLLREHLMQLSLQAPVLEVKLQVRRLLAAREMSGALFNAVIEGAENLSRNERLGRLLEQLRARLGETAILALKAQADHRPEKAQGTEAATMEPQPVPQSQAAMPRRPLWLLREPRSLGCGMPAPADLDLLQGPERIEAGWWDEHPIARDYYLAKSKTGALCWIFREQTAPSNWYLHGLFG